MKSRFTYRESAFDFSKYKNDLYEHSLISITEISPLKYQPTQVQSLAIHN